MQFQTAKKQAFGMSFSAVGAVPDGIRESVSHSRIRSGIISRMKITKEQYSWFFKDLPSIITTFACRSGHFGTPSGTGTSRKAVPNTICPVGYAPCTRVRKKREKTGKKKGKWSQKPVQMELILELILDKLWKSFTSPSYED